MRRLIALLGVGILLSGCAGGAAIPTPSQILQPTAPPPTQTAPSATLPPTTTPQAAATAAPSATPSVAAPTSTPMPPFEPTVVARLPADLAWAHGYVQDGPEDAQLFAVTPNGAVLMFEPPITFMIERPGHTPLGIQGYEGVVKLIDPVTGRRMNLQLEPGAQLAAGPIAADERNLLLIAEDYNPEENRYSSVIYQLDFERGRTTSVRYIYDEPHEWEGPVLFAWHGNAVYAYSYSSATRYVWRLRLDTGELNPELLLVMGNGGPIWLDAAGETLYYANVYELDNLKALDLETGVTTPFTGSVERFKPLDELPPPLQLPGVAQAIWLVYTP